MKPSHTVAAVLLFSLVGAASWYGWIHRTVDPEVVDTVDPVALNAVFATSAPQPAAGRTNVVLAIVCTFRRDRLEPYGMHKPTTPFLDGLSSRSVVLDHHIAQAPWTRPSMGSLLTSRWPRALQLDNPGPRGSLEMVLRQKHTTLAESLSDAGYRTIGSTGNPNMKEQFGLAQGLQRIWEPESTYEGVTIKVDGHDQVDFLMDELDRVPSDQPAYLQLVLTDTHQPRQVEPRYLDLFDRGGDKPGRRARYDASVRKVDGVLASLFVETLERRPDTIFVVASDHGEGLRHPRHHGAGHGNHLYSTHIYSPSIWYHPSVEARRIKGLTMNLDVVPTILGLLGIEGDDVAEGTDLSRHMLHGDPWAGHPYAFSETFYARSKKSTVISSEHQLIRRRRTKKDPPILETLHAASDVYAETDLLESSPEVAVELRQVLDEWEGEMARLWENAGAPEQVELSDEMRQQLEAIGYIE